MVAGIWNTFFGVLLIVGGLTGHTLVFTHSVELTYVAGGLMSAWGISQIVRSMGKTGRPPPRDDD